MNGCAGSSSSAIFTARSAARSRTRPSTVFRRSSSCAASRRSAYRCRISAKRISASDIGAVVLIVPGLCHMLTPPRRRLVATTRFASPEGATERSGDLGAVIFSDTDCEFIEGSARMPARLSVHGALTGITMTTFDSIGYWSELKLEILRKYASAYSTILAAQRGLYHVYVDAFAGAGMHLSRTTREMVPGSPLN